MSRRSRRPRFVQPLPPRGQVACDASIFFAAGVLAGLLLGVWLVSMMG